jgi:ectoine hydroxylase
MTVSDAQVDEYAEKGWIVLPSLLDETEVSVLNDAVSMLSRRDGPEVARENNNAPHVVYGMHLLDERMGMLVRHPALVAAAKKLLGKQFFVHQSRVNVKQTDGSIVKWHQDFGTYHRVDGLPKPDGIMIGIFLDDINPCNAPLLGIPGSHKRGIVSEASVDPSSEDFETVSRYRYDITPETIAELTEEFGVEPIMGPAGSVLLMDLTVVHGSTVNITPLRRVILYLNVSSVDNRGETYERPEYYAARDFSPIQASGKNCLRDFANLDRELT